MKWLKNVFRSATSREEELEELRKLSLVNEEVLEVRQKEMLDELMKRAGSKNNYTFLKSVYQTKISIIKEQLEKGEATK